MAHLVIGCHHVQDSLADKLQNCAFQENVPRDFSSNLPLGRNCVWNFNSKMVSVFLSDVTSFNLVPTLEPGRFVEDDWKDDLAPFIKCQNAKNLKLKMAKVQLS